MRVGGGGGRGGGGGNIFGVPESTSEHVNFKKFPGGASPHTP